MARRRALVGVVAVLLALTGAGCTLVDSADLEVEVTGGTVEGFVSDGQHAWLGIPYAAPPVGDLRWRPPQPVEPWSDVRDADAFGDRCVQLADGEVAVGSSEDCLYLNVLRPETEEEDLPVMVWIHGGSLRDGNGELAPDFARGLVEQGVVVVSMNYRLGRLGWFAHPSLGEEARAAGEEPVGNYGLLDQVAALQWVQDNIEEFGGDPDAVTLFGISAGGASVNLLMSSPLADGLFDRAIAGSGAGREEPPGWAEAAARGEELVAGLGAGPGAPVDELRDLPAEEVVRLPTYLLADEVPVLDASLPRSVADTFAAGEEAAVPYLVGSTDLEVVAEQYPLLGIDPAAVTDRLLAGDGAGATQVYGDEQEVARHLVSDLVFVEPARHLARLHSRTAPTYRYRFTIAEPGVIETYGGAPHGADLPYVFGWVESSPDLPDAGLRAEEVSECWASFAEVGVPRCGGVDWPPADDGALVELGNDGPRVLTEDPWDQRLDLVEALARATS